MLLSEDMRRGAGVAGLRVVNPFLAGNAERLSSGLGSF
jgi:predicted nucleic acid-binding protein